MGKRVEVKKDTLDSKKEAVVKEKKDNTASQAIDPVKAFKMAATAIDKKFPKAFHAWLYEEEKLIQRRFSSGSIGLDAALGGEGLPYGRLIEVWGPTGGGKTSWALETAWHLQQKTGLGVVFMDIERKFDASLLKTWKGGFLPNMTRIEMPESGEDTFATLLSYIESQGTGIIIVDSVSAIRSAKILDSDDQAAHFGAPANLIGQWLPKISSASARTGVPVLFVNQVRANFEAWVGAKGRQKIKKSGGFAYDHWICVSLYLGKNGKPLNDGAKDVAQWSKMVVMKNHSGHTYFKEINLLLQYGYGYDEVAELVDKIIALGIVGRNGAWFSWGDSKVMGRDNLIKEIKGNVDLKNYFLAEVRKTPFLAQTDDLLGMSAPSVWTGGNDDDDGVDVFIDSPSGWDLGLAGDE